MSENQEATKSAREVLLDRLVEWRMERWRLVQRLPLDLRARHGELTAKIDDLQKYLWTHTDEYIEKERAFDHSRCPRNVPWDSDEPCLAESPHFVECVITECPEFPTCTLKGPARETSFVL